MAMGHRIGRSNFMGFLRRPHLNDGRVAPLRVRAWIGWVGLILLADIVAGVIGRGGMWAFGVKIPPDKAIQHLLMHPALLPFVVLLIAPILEELVFRAMLSTQRWMVFIGSGLFVITLARLTLAVLTRHLSNHLIYVHYLDGVAMLLPLLAGYGLIWWVAGGWIMALFRRYPAPIFWTSAVLFGLVHSFNFQAGFKPVLILLTLPQMSAGVFLGYLRVRHGLRWSIATHMAIDYPVVFGAWLVLLAKTTLGVQAAGVSGLVLALVLIGTLIYGVAGLVRGGAGAASVDVG